MSVVFGGNVRGNFRKSSFKVSNSIVKVPAFGDAMTQNGTFVIGTSVRKVEKKAIIQCFNSTNHIYAFGADPESSMYSCSLGVFIAKCAGGKFQSTKGINKLISKYKQLRVSQKPAVVQMKIDDTAINGILVGLSVDVIDAELNLFRVTLMFNDIDP